MQRLSFIPAAELLQTSFHECRNRKQVVAGGSRHSFMALQCRQVMWLDNAQSTEAPVTSAYCAAKMAFGDIAFLLSFGARAILPRHRRQKHFEGWLRRPPDQKLTVNYLFSVRRQRAYTLYLLYEATARRFTIQSCISYNVFAQVYMALYIFNQQQSSSTNNLLWADSKPIFFDYCRHNVHSLLSYKYRFGIKYLRFSINLWLYLGNPGSYV